MPRFVAHYRKSKEYTTYCTLLDGFEKRGRFLPKGVGPLRIRERDVVYALFGNSFPFLLREKEKEENIEAKRYELVGEVYCDEITDGEALSMGLVEREFHLE